jgi:hypothetical protein
MRTRSGVGAGVLFAILVCLAAALAGCGKPASAPPSGALRQLKPGELTPAERKYGVAPKPDPSIVYQPDVVIVGGGAESVREQSANGFIWTIDANAEHADELVPGKVMFLTGRAVGRVLKVSREGDDLAVILGPVEITDVVRQADIVIESVPLDFDQAIAYTSTDLPGQQIPLAGTNPGPARAMPAMLMRTAGSVPPLPAPEPNWDVSKLVHFSMTPVVGQTGLGLEVKSTGGDLLVDASAYMAFRQPTLALTLHIRPSGVQEASVTLAGSAGLHWDFGLGTEVGRSANVKGRIEPPTEFSLPLGGSGLPLSVTVRQRFLIKTAFGARNSTLKAKGDYSFTGGLKAGYFGGRWQLAGPTNVAVEENLVHNTGGVSIAPTGVDLAHMIIVTVGIGAHGFTVGPYVAFTSSVGLFKGSDLGTIACREATMVMSMYAGVGYTMPKIVARIINLFLSVVGVEPRIEAVGSLAASESKEIHKGSTTLKGCNAGSGSG